MTVATRNVQTPEYRNLTEIYECYRSPVRFLVFEHAIYRFKGIESKGDISIHNYRSNEEQHTLRIYLHSAKVYFVDGVYSIGETYDNMHTL